MKSTYLYAFFFTSLLQKQLQMSKIEQKCQKDIPGSNFGAKKAEKNLAAKKKSAHQRERYVAARLRARVCVCVCVCGCAQRRVCVRARACSQMHIYFVI